MHDSELSGENNFDVLDIDEFCRSYYSLNLSSCIDFHAYHSIISKLSSLSEAILFHALHRLDSIHNVIIFVVNYCKIRRNLRRVKQIFQELSSLALPGR